MSCRAGGSGGSQLPGAARLAVGGGSRFTVLILGDSAAAGPAGARGARPSAAATGAAGPAGAGRAVRAEQAAASASSTAATGTTGPALAAVARVAAGSTVAAGNLDIMTAAATKVGEEIAKERVSVSEGAQA